MPLKQLSTFLFPIILPVWVYAQSDIRNSLPTNYLGVGTGINATGIVGITYEHIFKEHIGTYVNMGASTWGTKIGAGGRLYLKDAHSGAFAMNITYVTGKKGAEAQLEVVENGIVNKKTVRYDLHPLEVLGFSYLKFWKMGRKARFNIEMGYAVLLSGKGNLNYTIISPGVKLSENSEKVLTLKQPGGLLLAIGFTFGL
jgi:hypothetical protein